MPTITIEGKSPLNGTVTLSGAKNSAIKLIFAAMYSNDDVVLDNVPNVTSVNSDIEIIRSIGGKAEWVGINRLLLNGGGISKWEIPYEIGSKFRTTLLLAGPLLYRFGKAVLPRVNISYFKPSPINRWVATWESLGIKVEQTDTHVILNSEHVNPATINFRTTSHMATDNAILSSLFIEGETIISNASEEPEIEDLIKFCNAIGGNVKRTEPRTIVIRGSSLFTGGDLSVQSDKLEAAFFSAAALLSKGNIIIKEVNRESLLQFINFLTKTGASFDFSEGELKVWRHSESLAATNLPIMPSPGFIPDWQPIAAVMLTQAKGVSWVHDTVYTDRFSYITDLNRLGADIELMLPSSQSIIPVISDDSYDFAVRGEPFTLAKIAGPSSLKGKRIQMSDPRVAYAYILAGLTAEGKTEIIDYDPKYEPFEGLFTKLASLGARVNI